MKKSDLKQIIKEEIIKLNESYAIQARVLAGRVLMDMRLIHKLPEEQEGKFLERFSSNVNALKKSLSLLRVDHPSLGPAYRYVVEISSELDPNFSGSTPSLALKSLGSGSVIKEFIEKVYKPLEKVIDIFS